MSQFQKLEGRKPAQLELPFGYSPRKVERGGGQGARTPRVTTPRPSNDNSPFASSHPHPTRRVFHGGDIGKKPAKLRSILTLADLAAYVGPGPDSPDCYGE